jgi:hypothetical protein
MKNYIVAQNIEDHLGIPAGGLVLWGGASAPEGWSFDADLDGMFVLGGTATDLTLRGADTHAHAVPATASGGGHNNHTVNVAKSGYPTVVASSTAGGDNADVVGPNHTHEGSATSQSLAGAHNHTWPNTNSVSNVPEYVGLRWITGGQAVPIGGIVMASSSFVIPDDWALCDGTNGTPDMRDKFVRATANSGGNASHAHSVGASSSNGAHVHTVNITSDIGWAGTWGTGASHVGAAVEHRHYANNLSSANAGAHAHSMGNTGSANHLPPFITVWFIRRMA